MARGICWKPGQSGNNSSRSWEHQRSNVSPNSEDSFCCRPGSASNHSASCPTTSAAPCSTIGHGCDLPGPQSQDDDEDSLPIVQELDRAEHTQCSSYHPPLTHSLGASAHGSEKLPQVTPASPPTNANLSGNFGKKEEENAKLTLTPMRRNSISLVNEH